MSEQQTPKAPVLCKMGCGFFGSDATGNCCSKCWMQSLKKTPPASAMASSKKELSRPAPVDTSISSKSEPMEICQEITKTAAAAAAVETESPAAASASTAAATTITTTTTTTTKKKKKKTSYKAMMAGMMTAQNSVKLDKEREALKNGLGGGSFTKIEKI